MAKASTKTDLVLRQIAPQAPADGGGAVPAPVEARDIQEITAEILTAKQDAGKAILRIGRALMEAKEQLPHGDWLDWLEREVDFSERTAENFMRIAREYSNPQLVADLGVRKAVNLLAIPAPEREAFIAASHTVGGEDKKVQDMTARELEQAIRERDEARKELEREKANVQEWRTRARDFEKEKEEAEDAARIVEKDNAELRKKAAVWEQTRSDNAVMSRDNAELRDRVKKLEEIEKEYNDMKSRPTDVAVETKVVRDEEAIREAVEAAKKERAETIKGLNENIAGLKENLRAHAKDTQRQMERADALAKEVETLKAEKENAEKAAAKYATPDRAAASYLVTQMAQSLSSMAGYLKKARESGDKELEAAIRAAVKKWIAGLEEMAK